MSTYKDRTDYDYFRVFRSVEEAAKNESDNSERVNIDPVSIPKTRKAAITILHRLGVFSLNQRAVTLLGVKPGSVVAIEQIGSDKRDLRLVINPDKDGRILGVKDKRATASGIYSLRFINAPLARRLLKLFGSENKNLIIPLSSEIIDGTCNLITRRARIPTVRQKGPRNAGYSSFPFSLINPKTFLQFCSQNWVEVIWDDSCSYLCDIS